MSNSNQRRLLSPVEVAQKLGFSIDWLNVHEKTTLKNSGFPTPILGGGNGSPRRWDDHAIDLWMDKHLSPELQVLNLSLRDQTNLMITDPMAIEQQLANRAMELRL